jgi:hypothetical protein
MAELQNGQIIPLNAAIASSHDANGKPLEFKAVNEKDKNNTSWVAEGSDGKTYTVNGQQQIANVSVVKKGSDINKAAKVKDPYVLRLEANAPKAGNAESTEEREKEASGGKIAERKDVQQSQSFAKTEQPKK